MLGLGKVIIGGGTGFIGSSLAKKLKNYGYEVLIISRKPGESRISWNDITSNGLPENVTAVVNLCGQNILDPTRRWTDGFKQNVWASRVQTTRYLADAIDAATTKPKVFVTTSGVGYYEPSSSREYDEDSPGGDFDFLSKLCTDWENAAKVNSDVRQVTIRLGVVLGRNGGMIQQLFLPFYFGLGGPVSSGSQYLPWIHIKDATSLYLHAIENENVSGILNGVAPDIVTNAQFASTFGEALWRPAFIPLPSFFLNLMFSEDRAKIMTEGQKVLPKKTLESGFHFEYPDIKSATNEFSKLVYKDE